MLTRLEVDGFKNLLGFSVDFGPFTCIAGPNGVGKSNIFDAIRFLSLLADHTLMEAALQIRGTDPSATDIGDIFWTDGRRRVEQFRIAAEMIVEPKAFDDFGRPADASSTFLRYQLEIGHEKPSYHGGLGRLVLLSEELRYITEGDAPAHLLFPHRARSWRSSAVVNTRRTKSGYISTEKAADGQTEILVHQERSAGKPQRAPAATAPRTIVATSNTSSTPTILAARREMQSWRILSLEPTAMRGSDRFQDDSHVTANGAHLPATLYRLAESAKADGDSTDSIYARIASRLSDLVPIIDVHVTRDDVRQLLTIEVEEKAGVTLPTRSLSDGTLRFLTLCILAEDPEAQGVICMEEPENGIHPAKLEAMINLLRDLVTNTEQQLSRDNPMRQVLIATHSPGMVQLQNPEDVLFASEVAVQGPWGEPARTLRCKPLTDTWRCIHAKPCIGLGTILAYLTTPPGAQITLNDF